MLPYVVVVETLYALAAEIVDEPRHLVATDHLPNRKRTTAKMALDNGAGSIGSLIDTWSAHQQVEPVPDHKERSPYYHPPDNYSHCPNIFYKICSTRYPLRNFNPFPQEESLADDNFGDVITIRHALTIGAKHIPVKIVDAGSLRSVNNHGNNFGL